jgi:hypothetical protein
MVAGPMRSNAWANRSPGRPFRPMPPAKSRNTAPPNRIGPGSSVATSRGMSAS